jgi:hypothetical protein
LKQRLCSAKVLSLLDLQEPFEIETNASDYVMGVVLTQHGHPMAYHSETLLDVVRKYPIYDKEMYSIVQACRQWRHYILGKEIIIHTDHKPLQFMQTQGKLQTDHHQKWSTYLQQFQLNIKYKTGSTNRVVDCLSRPPVAALATMLDSCGHETSGWTTQSLPLTREYPHSLLPPTLTVEDDLYINEGDARHTSRLAVMIAINTKPISLYICRH